MSAANSFRETDNETPPLAGRSSEDEQDERGSSEVELGFSKGLIAALMSGERQVD